MGNYFKNKLENLKNTYPFIKEVRGKGLMLGVEVNYSAKEILKKCMDKGLLIGTAGEKVLRFMPPLIIKKKDIDEGMTILEKVLHNLE